MINNDTVTINLARQRYEKQQQSKLPTVTVKLSTEGKIYPKDHILSSGVLEMRHMTAYDEDILTNSSYAEQQIVFDKLLESVIISNVNISDISPADKLGLIIDARILSYGHEYPVTVRDKSTMKNLDRVIDLRKLKNKPFKLVADELGEFEYAIPNSTIKFSYNVTEIKSNKIDESHTVSQFLNNVIKQVGDSRLPADIDNFIRYNFLLKDSRIFRKFYKENEPGLNFTYEFEGEDGGAFTAGFQFTADLFWF